MKKKFRVWVKTESYCYIDVEADTKEEAIAIGEDSDCRNFTNKKDLADWEIKDAVELDDQGVELPQ